ncbi:MAG TPA: tetratricopeptide repeat protein [Candidatus Gastranaerophilales bacterium]|nr:tetratricopeptide repeat protein [Candidatus Gastranaerophilales bacterium]
MVIVDPLEQQTFKTLNSYVDRNNDGGRTIQEFQSSIFGQFFDKNKDGDLSIEETKNALKNGEVNSKEFKDKIKQSLLAIDPSGELAKNYNSLIESYCIIFVKELLSRFSDPENRKGLGGPSAQSASSSQNNNSSTNNTSTGDSSRGFHPADPPYNKSDSVLAGKIKDSESAQQIEKNHDMVEQILNQDTSCVDMDDLPPMDNLYEKAANGAWEIDKSAMDYQMGQIKDAKETLDVLAEQYPNDPLVKAAQAELDAKIKEAEQEIIKYNEAIQYMDQVTEPVEKNNNGKSHEVTDAEAWNDTRDAAQKAGEAKDKAAQAYLDYEQAIADASDGSSADKDDESTISKIQNAQTEVINTNKEAEQAQQEADSANALLSKTANIQTQDQNQNSTADINPNPAPVISEAPVSDDSNPFEKSLSMQVA